MSRTWTLLPHFRGKRAYFKVNLLSILVLLCALLLPGCGESTPKGYDGSATSKGASSDSSDTLQPLIAPPHKDDLPAAPGTTGAPKTADGLPLLQPPKGVNTALFAEKMDDEGRRMDRLENAVQELRNDFDNMAPAIVRLVSIEGDIQNLISQLQVLTGDSPTTTIDAAVTPIDEAMLDAPQKPVDSTTPAVPAPPVDTDQPTADSQTSATPPISPQPQTPAQENAAPENATGPPAPAATPPPPVSIGPPEKAEAVPAAPPAPDVAKPSTASSAVEVLRVGKHPDKVRIVLDVKGKTSFTTDLDNQEKILVVELPDAGWNAESQKSFDGNPLLSSYRTEKLGDHGTMLIIQLKSASEVTYKSVMDNPDGQGQRVIIDLAMPK